MKKIKQEEALDSYYMIVSIELSKGVQEIIKIYRGFWKIEESLKARPVYVSTKDHSEGHFLTCFISLVIIRLLEKIRRAKNIRLKEL